MSRLLLPALCLISLVSGRAPLRGQPAADPYPLGDALRVLEEDIHSDNYRALVGEMLHTDLQAEWQRVDAPDSAEHFLADHGGLDAVQADPELKAAYARRLEIREQFLELMRAGFRRHNSIGPFDQGAEAERAGTTAGNTANVTLRATVVLPVEDAAPHWPRFRGPSGQGETDGVPLPLHWSATENILWRTTLSGEGNSSPVLWGDRIFVTSAAADGSARSLHCLSRERGEPLWSREVPAHTPEPMVRDKNGFASATPVTDGERVIGYFGNGGLAAFSLDGEPLWHFPTPGFDSMWGSGASPVLYRDTVILIHDQNRGESLFVCLDKRTGTELWRRPREQAMGWSTPTVVHVGDHDELLYAGRETVRGYDPATGEELWVLSGPTHEVVPTLVVGDDLVFSASGRQGPTLALRPGGHGDVSDSHLVWRTTRGGPHVPSPIYHRGRLYTVNDTGIALCLDAKTGAILWQQRIRDKFSASPIVSGDHLYFPGESGVTWVLKAQDTFEIVAQNDLGVPLLASPAAVAGRLYLRSPHELVAIGEGG